MRKNYIITIVLLISFSMLGTIQTQAQTISTTTWYNIISQKSNLCVEAKGNGTTNGTIVDQWTCGTAKANQLWEFQTTSGGYYKVVNKNAPTETWDVVGGSTTNGALIDLWTYGSNHQEWQPVSVGSGYYKFINRNSGLCLDDPGNSTTTGTQYDQWTCNGGSNQAFQLVASGGIPNPTNTPTGGGSFVVSENQFDSWFPSRVGLYTYANFITALSSYSSIAQSGNSTNDKIEAAAFFAHVAHESGYLQYTNELSYTPGYYSACGTYPCASGQDYHGRGPLQISWNYNYYMAATGMYYANPGGWVSRMTPTVGGDVYNNPELVNTDGVITWKTALWFWLDHGLDWDPSKTTPHQHIAAGGAGFGATINDINGGIECGQAVGSAGYNEMMDRVNIYNTFLSNLGVSDSRTKTC